MNQEFSRRDFLSYSIWGLALFLGVSLGTPMATYFLSPIWKEGQEDWILLGETDKIPSGKPTRVEFLQRRKDGWTIVEERRTAWVLTRDGKDFTVFDPTCPHLGCPYRWDDSKKQFLCPCHSGVFDIEGNVLSGPPPRPLNRLMVKVEEGKLWVLPGMPKKG